MYRRSLDRFDWAKSYDKNTTHNVNQLRYNRWLERRDVEDQQLYHDIAQRHQADEEEKEEDRGEKEELVG